LLSLSDRLPRFLFVFVAVWSIQVFIPPGLVHAGIRGVSFLDELGHGAYPSAHCVLAREIEDIQVRDDGSYSDTDEVYIKVLDEKGKRRQQVQNFYVNRHYSRLSIELFEVIRPSGRHIPVDIDANSRETEISSISRRNIYDPNQRVIKVFVPGLSIGDTIHYIVKVERFKPMIEGQFFGRAVVQRSYPVHRSTIRIWLPSGKAFHHLLKDKCPDAVVSFHSSSHGGRKAFSWTFEHIPELVPEPDMPDPSRVAMRLLFSTLSSWRAVSAWYYGLVEPKLKCTPEIRNEVKRLVRGKRHRNERLSSLFFFSHSCHPNLSSSHYLFPYSFFFSLPPS